MEEWKKEHDGHYYHGEPNGKRKWTTRLGYLWFQPEFPCHVLCFFQFTLYYEEKQLLRAATISFHMRGVGRCFVQEPEP